MVATVWPDTGTLAGSLGRAGAGCIGPPVPWPLVDVPSAIVGVVLAELAVGGLLMLWGAPTWGAVRHGYEILLGGTLALIGWGAWASLRGPLSTVRVEGATSHADLLSGALLTMTVLGGISVVALVARLATPARVIGALAAVAGLVAFVPLAQIRADRGGVGGVVQGVVELALGAFLLGAIWDGMILGHWYLVERRLSNRYMVWMARANVVAVVGGLVAVLLSARSAVPCDGLAGAELEQCAFGFSPLLSVGSMTIMMGLGVVGLLGVIAIFNVKLANEGGRSIQAGTGMFYLAVILAPAAEFAAKVRFF